MYAAILAAAVFQMIGVLTAADFRWNTRRMMLAALFISIGSTILIAGASQ